MTSQLQLTGNRNNYEFNTDNTHALYTISADVSGRIITGITGGTTGGADSRVIRVLNAGTTDIIVTHEDTASIAVNRITMPLEVDMVLRPNDLWTLVYNAISSRWFVASGYEGYVNDPEFVSEMHDDFIYGTNGNGTFGELGWSFNSNGGAATVSADETAYLGAAKITSGTLASGRGELVSNNPVNFVFPKGFIYEATVRYVALSPSVAGLTAYTSIVGISNNMASSGSISTTQAIAFTYDQVGLGSLTGANWCCLSANTSREATNSGVAVSTAYQRLKIVFNTAGTQAKFYINGALVATNTTHFPNTGLNSFKFGIWNDATVGTHTSNTMYVEYFKFRMFRTTRRA